MPGDVGLYTFIVDEACVAVAIPRTRSNPAIWEHVGSVLAHFCAMLRSHDVAIAVASARHLRLAAKPSCNHVCERETDPNVEREA